MRIDIKPLSVNLLYRGGPRYKSDEYIQYRDDVMWQLKPRTFPEGKFGILLKFGVSNSRQDLDNLLKGFLDILQEKYGINDNRYYYIGIKKLLVKKGNEYIDFEILPIGG